MGGGTVPVPNRSRSRGCRWCKRSSCEDESGSGGRLARMATWPKPYEEGRPARTEQQDLLPGCTPGLAVRWSRSPRLALGDAHYRPIGFG